MRPKSILKFTAYMVAFLITLVIILALVVDANMFKPRLIKFASDHGVELNLRGDLHWAFWPSIGLAIKDVSVADANAPKKIIADIKQMSFLVAFVPLMKGDLQVKNILVDSATINLEVDEQGVGNWQKLIDKQTNHPAEITPNNSDKANIEKTTSNNTDSKTLKLAIEKISLKSSQITYVNFATGQRLALKDIQFETKDVNVKGRAFNVDMSSETEISDVKFKTKTPILIKSKLHASLTIVEGLNSLALDGGDLQLDLHATDSANIKLTFSLKLDYLKNNLSFQGNFAIPTSNLKQLISTFGVNPVTANPNALREISVSSDFKGDKKQLVLSNLVLRLDKTEFNGAIELKDYSSKELALDLHGSEIVLDDYLAPAATEKTSTTESSAGDEPLIPVELLRGLNADIKLSFNKIIFINLAFEKSQFTLTAKNGLVRQQLKANTYSGNIHQKSDVDVRNQNPHIVFDAQIQGVEIAPILEAKKLDGKLKLSGAIQADASGQASGVSKNQIMDSLSANSNISGAKMRLAPLNIEQQFCQFISLVNRAEAPARTWNGYTELREVSGKIAVAKRIIHIESLTAGVEKLLLNSSGSIDLGKGSYDFILPLKLVRDATDTPTRITTSTQGCTITSNYWTERSMNLLHCRGKYAEINPVNDCRPDKEMLSALIKDFASFKLKEKHGEKLDAKKSELIKKLDEKLGGESATEKAKDRLKKLFNK